MSNELLPSPGGIWGEWGLNSAVLPSPLTFPTPNDGKGPSGLGLSAVGREEGEGGKRKGEEGLGPEGEGKRIKT
jgi:hypothetical protein